MAASEEPGGLVLESVEQHSCERCGVEMDVFGVEPFKSFNCPECGAPFAVPARLGPFLLVSQIGRGGMGGVVFLARDELLDRSVAIKIMPASASMTEEVVATFRREAQAAARLNHPNIAQVYSFGQENGQPYIVMELLTGSSLDKMIDEQGQLDEGFVVHLGLQIAQGLRAADEAGLTHGDIKPENILFDDKMNAKLVDFGIASFVNQATEGIWGTPYYIAPERLLRMKSDARSDMYCLGGTLYHALTGRPPFDGRTPAEVVRARLEIDPAPVGEHRRGIHEEVEGVVMRMLKREPAVRHPTYASLIADFTRAARAVPYGGPTGTFASVKTGKKVVAGATGHAPRATGGLGKSSGPIKIYAKSRESQKLRATSRHSTGSISTPKVSGGGASTVRRLIKGMVWLLILGVLAAGGVWLYMSVKERRDTQSAGRMERVTIQKNQKKVPALCTTIQQAVSNVNRYAATACGQTGPVIRAVQSVLNETLELPPPPAPPPEAVATNLPAADTNSPPAQGTNVAARGTNVVTRGARPAAGGTNAAAAKADAGPPPEPLAAEPAPPPVPTPPDPEIKALAKKALVAVRDILNARDKVDKLAVEAGTLRDAVLAATASAVVADRLEKLTETAEECKTAEAEAKKRLGDAKELTAKVTALQAKVEQRRGKEQKEQEERIKREQAEKEKQEAEQRRRVLAESEVASAKVSRNEIQAHMKQYTFAKAVEDLKARRADYKTDEGKAELDKSIDRYQRMAALHRFIVGRLATQPFGWGWISSRSAEDVIGADDQGVKTKNRTYPWADVSIRQYLHFFGHYAGDKDLRAREASDNYLAAAIFCMESVHGMDSKEKAVESATNKAREYIAEARRLLPTSSTDQDISRLVPAE